MTVKRDRPRKPRKKTLRNDEQGKKEARHIEENLPHKGDGQRVEDTLLSGEATLNSIFRAAPVGIGLVINRIFIKVNDLVCSMTGYSRDELIGKNASMLYPSEEEYTRVGNEKYRQIAKSGLGTVETLWKRKDGAVINVLLSSSPLDRNDLLKGVTFTVLDITDRKRVEESLRISEEKYRHIVETASEGIWSMDSRYLTTFVNRHMADMLEYEPDEMIGKPVDYFMFPQDLDDHGSKMKNRSAGQGDIYERRFRTKSGREIWTIVSARALKDDQGNFAGSFAMFTDITERRRTELALRMEKDMATMYLDNVEVLITVLRSDQSIGMINRKGSQLLGYEADEMIGRNWFDLCIAEQEREKIKEVFDMIIHGNIEPVEYFENEVITKTGAVRLIAWHNTIIRDEKEDITGILSSGSDITEKRKSENELRISRERLDLALDASTDGIWDWDISGGSMYFSPRWYTMLGYAPGELDASYETWKTLLHPEDIGRTEQRVRETLASPGGLYSAEFRMKTKDGSWTWILARGKVVKYDDKGNPLRFIGTHTDLTEMKRVEDEKVFIEKQLAQAQKMEAIGNLAGGLAHDFNNVLGAMKGSLDIMETYLDQEALNSKEKIYKYLGTAQSSAQRAAGIIKQLLTLSRSDKQRLEPIDINLSLKHILKIAENSFPKSVILDFTFAETPLYIMADPTQIEQVFLNICVNASHAMTIMRDENDREGGRLSITIKKVTADKNFNRNHADAVPGKSYVRTDVRDTGVGIDRQNIKKIFEPFFTTKDIDQGTGLGLSMVYNIIKMHEGFIDVSSETGKGTLMSVYIPVLESRESDRKDSDQSAIEQGSGTILVIDDEETILAVAGEFLTGFGYRVLEAHGPLAGLEMFRTGHAHIDLVLLDLSMPVMSGHELFLELKKIDPGVRVLLSSGFSHDIRVQKTLDAGARGFIAKPYSKTSLSRKVKEMLSLK